MRSNPRRYLFLEANTHAVIDHQRQLLRAKIGQMTTQDLADVETVALRLGEEFSINVPMLDETAIHTYPPTEVRIDISQDLTRLVMNRGQLLCQKGTEIRIGVPFSGDEAMFRIRPMQFTSMPPQAEVDGSQLIFKKVGINLEAASVRAEFDQWLRDVKQYLDWHRSSVGNFNQEIVSLARSEIQKRVGQLSANQNLASGLGFPVRG